MNENIFYYTKIIENSTTPLVTRLRQGVSHKNDKFLTHVNWLYLVYRHIEFGMSQASWGGFDRCPPCCQIFLEISEQMIFIRFFALLPKPYWATNFQVMFQFWGAYLIFSISFLSNIFQVARSYQGLAVGIKIFGISVLIVLRTRLKVATRPFFKPVVFAEALNTK